MGGTSGGGSSSENRVRYPPYLESVHNKLLSNSGADSPTVSVVSAFNTALSASPYGNYSTVDVDNGFFDSGYTISSYPSLFDMFGVFMAGVNPATLWTSIYADTLDNDEVVSAVAAHRALAEDELETNVLPRFRGGMRDINAVQSSAFVVGLSILEDGVSKSVNDFQAKIRLKMVDTAAGLFAARLDWKKSVMSSYLDLQKHYFVLKSDLDTHSMELESKDALWTLGLFDYVRAVMGAMAGTAAATGQANMPGAGQKAIGGGLSGAATGAMIATGNPLVGAAVGGALGIASAFF